MLIQCPECEGKISDKALSCPHCGFPLKQAPAPVFYKRKRRSNGTGSIVDRGKRLKKRYEVRVNCHLDDRGYPVYDVLGRYEERDRANLELALYNENPYDLKKAISSFSQVYELWFREKYKNGKREFSKSSIDSTKAAYKRSSKLHDKIFKNITTQDLQNIIDTTENDGLSRSTIDNIKNLYTQMWEYAISKNIAAKNIAQYVQISVEENETNGTPFSNDEIKILWNSLNIEYVDIIIIYIYSGWRVTELLQMPTRDINLEEGTFLGGKKTRSGKNRIVPIHSKIKALVERRIHQPYLLMFDEKPMNYQKYREIFKTTLRNCGITTPHTQKDTRHTFATLLDEAGANEVAIKRMMGHSLKKDITKGVYTHKDIEQLRKNIELI